MDTEDRRRLNRSVPWSHAGDGQYSTKDSMHSVRRVASHKWERGVHQPYNIDHQFDFKTPGQQFKRLRDAQGTVEVDESKQPRVSTMRTLFNDRRGL